MDSTGIFDPSLAMIGDNTVQVTVSEGGCSYDTTLVITVVPTPIALFDVAGTPCIDSTLQVVFSGDAISGADFQWEFDGAEIVSGALPYDFDIRWNTPGAVSYTHLDVYKRQLVASGLDSIVWLTGDIANPTHILLSMSGEAVSYTHLDVYKRQV